jgi:hypothetical protein
MNNLLSAKCGFILTVILLLLPGYRGQAAELSGRAILAADTFAPGSTTAQFKKTRRTTPFSNAQPVQGFSSAIAGTKPGTFLVISDNGFGSKANSLDYGLRIYAVEPDFVTGKVFPVNFQTGERLLRFNRQSFVELSDKQSLMSKAYRNSLINFPIVATQTNYPGSNIPVSGLIKANRLLTGGDLDIESFRRSPDGSFWMGDEFGPFLLNFGANGELLEAPFPTPNLLRIGQSDFVKSPDHPEFDPDFTKLADNVARNAAANLGGSKGFEGMALNPQGTKLYAMLEGAIKDDVQKKRLLIYEFDLSSKKYTGQVFAYQLENPNYAIGDLTAVNNEEFLVIERDNNQGDSRNPAFKAPAQFKRIYKINLHKVNQAGFVEKELLVDLLNISDPNGIGGNGTKNGAFVFPFVTIESVLPLDERTLLVINDNNYADSIGRIPEQIDNTEFIRISLKEPLNLSR